jgi:hypothetical protein
MMTYDELISSYLLIHIWAYIYIIVAPKYYSSFLISRYLCLFRFQVKSIVRNELMRPIARVTDPLLLAL